MSGFPNRRFWLALAIVFSVLTLVSLVIGSWLGAIIAVFAALWTGLEASGRGAFGGEGTRETQ